MDQKIIASRNSYALNGDGTATLTITRRSGKTYDILIDADRLKAVKRDAWRVVTGKGDTFSVATGSQSVHSYCPLSWLITGTPKAPLVVYFVDGNWKNCTAANLRTGTRQQATAHGSKLKHRDGSGYVISDKRDGSFYAYGYLNGKKIYLGGWPTKKKRSRRARNLKTNTKGTNEYRRTNN